MKKIYSYISIIALAAVSAGCAEELVSPDEMTPSNQEQAIEGELTVNLSVPTSAQTKTVLGAKDGSAYPVYWSPEDIITLNGTPATEFTPSADGTSAEAKFKLANLAAPFNFLYGGVSGMSDQISFPATQKYVADSFDPAAMPMYASLSNVNGDVAFSHVGSLLRFSFTGEHKISSISLTAADETKSLSGNFTIGTTSSLLDGTLTPVSGSASLLYNLGDGIQLSENPSVFYIAVPAGTYPGGIVLEVLDTEAGHMTVKVMESEETATITAGKVREFDNVVYAPQKEANLIQINSDATLQAFATRVAAGETTLNARVTSDFTVTSTWTPVSNYKGIFDGNSKTITGLDQPLFATLEGVVKNLTLNSTINSDDAENANCGMFARAVIPSSEVDDVAGIKNCTAKGTLTYAPTSAVSGNIQVGGFVGLNRGGEISGCTNEAVITMGNGGVTHEDAIYVAGLVAMSQKGGDLGIYGEITNCTNNGSVICNTQCGNNVNVGGIVGYQTGSGETISGCVNNGLVKVGETFSTAKALHIGGVLGMGNGYIESSSNGSQGEVVSEEGSTAGTYICQGGVVGRINHGSRTYSGLANAGNLTVAASGAATGAYVGGMIGRCDEGASLSDCTNTGGSIEYTGTAMSCPLYIGGLAGVMKNDINSCTNATSITFAGTAQKNVCIGGVTGYSDGSIQAENDGIITLSDDTSVEGGDLLVGGIVGRVNNSDELVSCTNRAAITNHCEIITDGKYLQIGGVTGWNNGTPVNECYNSGDINNTANSAGYLYIGGITSESGAALTKCENSGNIENSGISANEWNVVGGVAGMNGGHVFTSCVNKAEAEIYNHCKATGIHIGGVTGFVNNTAEFIKCTNEGEVAVSNSFKISSGDHITVGGVVGRSAAVVSYDECINKGYVHVHIGSSDTRGGVFVGGIFGDNVKEDITCLNCENRGMVELYNTNSPSSLSDYALGGIAGAIKQNDGTSLISGCKNYNELFINANRGVIGGISGQFCDGVITNCTNTSKVVYSRNKSYKMYIAAGGIVGNAYGKADEISECFNAGEVLSLSLTDEYKMGNYVGGVVGWLENPCVVTDCTNTGKVTCSTGEKNEYVAAIAGGIIGYKESEGTDSGNKNWGVVAATGLYVSGSKGYPSIAGGIVGALTKGKIEGCYNYGDIVAGQNKSAPTDKEANYFKNTARAGSIAGYYTTGTEPFEDCNGTITKCHVGGWVKNASYSSWKEITSSNFGGLIVGLGSDPTDCYFAKFVEAPQPQL